MEARHDRYVNDVEDLPGRRGNVWVQASEVKVDDLRAQTRNLYFDKDRCHKWHEARTHL